MRYLITGAGRGLGLELAKQAESQFHTVLALTRQDWDVRTPSKFVDDGFDRVIVNAAIKDEATALNSDPATVLDVLNVNSVGALRTVQSVHHCLAPNAKIVIMTSQMGSSALTGAITLHGRYGDHYIPPTYSIGYRMSKAAVNKLVQCLAVDLKPRNISVYAIDPGWPKTDMGGQFASMEVDYSAKSVLATIENLTHDDTGSFVDWKGNKLEW